MSEAITLEWRKRSRSGTHGGDNCVEVAFGGPVVAVRDSKGRVAGLLAFPSAEWRVFVRGTFVGL